MYSKIALGNVKKSFKDYSIYFLTLTLAVSIFYSFNSIESQKAMLELNSSATEYIDMLSKIIGGISVFVSFILGSLILYANNFLIKKRKKELGIYMTLGMGKQKISKILILETFIVGIMSLISGLILGFVISQGLSLFTAKLFEVGMSEYKFLISGQAIVKTTVYFGIIFLIVMVFNTIIISKYKIIDLLVAGRKNENIKFKNPLLYLITFLLSVASLGYAYRLIFEVGLDAIDIKFKISILLGIIGTFLFFYSLAGFGLYVLKVNKSVYYKNLNIFIVKQINSKVNTNFISMSVICLMLFLTMGILSTGISFKNALESGLSKTTPFDASAVMYTIDDDKDKSIEKSLKKLNFDFDKSDQYVYYKEYQSDIDIKSLSDKFDYRNENSSIKNMMKIKANILKISDYNKIRDLEGKKEIKLGSNEVLIMSNNSNTSDILENILDKDKSVTIKGKKYEAKDGGVIKDSLHTSTLSDNIFTIVVNDDLTKGLASLTDNMNVNFKGDKEKSEAKFIKLFNEFKDGDVDYSSVGFINGVTKDSVYSQSKGITNTILFIGIYLGIIFLISSMAVLALQQLSEASDSVERYKSLRRIGANDKMINRSIFIQTLIYFTLPVGLAFIHAVVGIDVVNDFIKMFNKPDIGTSALITSLIFMLVYIGYFYATYVGYKNIVKKQ